jgi:hypothetical protein
MDEKRRCDTCNVEISKTNWSKQTKTKKHLEAVQKQREVNERSDEGVQINRCEICNLDVPENERSGHLKSPSHKRSTKLIKDKLKEKVRSFNVRRQRKRNFQDIDFETNDYIVKKSEEALEGCFLTLRITPKNEVNSVYVLIEELPELVFERMKYILEHKTATKLQIVLKGKFRKFHPATGREEFEEITIASKNQIILREDEIEETIYALLLEIHEKIESWDNNEGYWHLVNVVNVDFKLREYKPLSGSSYLELPKWIYNKKATINIKNEDQKCFKYCLQYHKHKNEITHRPERVSWYSNWNNDYDFSNIKFPVEVDDIKKFCKQNNISINLYVVNGKSIQPYLTCSQDEKKSDHVNLLLIEEEEPQTSSSAALKSHYVYIKSLPKLVRDQLTKHEHHHFICERCFYHTENIEVFRRHQILCDNYFDNEKAIPILPKFKDKILKFKNIHKTNRVPLVYYADLEAVLRK